MFYDKKIKYFDYYERGERIKGCGFAKIEVRGEELRIELTVSGLYPTDSFAREVMLCSEKQEKHLAQIELAQGRGELKRIYHNRSDIGGTGIPYWELCGICIHLGGEREISCRWQKSENKSAEMFFKKGAEGSLHAAAIPVEAPISESMRAPMSEPARVPISEPMRAPMSEPANTPISEPMKVLLSEPAKVSVTEPMKAPLAPQNGRTDTAANNIPLKLMRIEREKKPEDERVTEKKIEKERAAEQALTRKESTRKDTTGRGSTGEDTTERGNESQTAVKRDTTVRDPSREERKHPRMLDDKWLQLCAIYPHVQPFRDERDYLSIKPADFLLFPANAYRQVNNSFLLHGYYNYKHLLLSRIERKGEILYYIGVPGNYYEKEKQVALMFGFESFECADEPAEDGDFGYYMMRMEL